MWTTNKLMNFVYFLFLFSGISIFLGKPFSLKNDINKYVSWSKIDVKTLFSIAITLTCRGGRYSFPCIAPFTIDLYFVRLNLKQGGIKYNSFSF